MGNTCFLARVEGRQARSSASASGPCPSRWWPASWRCRRVRHRRTPSPGGWNSPVRTCRPAISPPSFPAWGTTGAGGGSAGGGVITATAMCSSPGTRATAGGGVTATTAKNANSRYLRYSGHYRYFSPVDMTPPVLVGAGPERSTTGAVSGVDRVRPPSRSSGAVTPRSRTLPAPPGRRAGARAADGTIPARSPRRREHRRAGDSTRRL